MSAAPYSCSPEFDEQTLPAALRANHSTKAGVWGMIRVIEGRLRLAYIDPPREVIVDPETPALVLPQQVHFVTPLGPMRMRVDFYRQRPDA